MRQSLLWMAVLRLVIGGSAVLSATLPWNEQAVEVGEPPAGDWPMYRRDPALTAVSQIRGGLAIAPEVAWSVDLGGPKIPAERVVVRDVTGAGRDEFLTLGADTITCRDSRGRVLWKLDNYPNANVVDVRDFAGDGSRGILLTTYLAGTLDTYMISGRRDRWRYRFPAWRSSGRALRWSSRTCRTTS
jgi:hypothetical protein